MAACCIISAKNFLSLHFFLLCRFSSKPLFLSHFFQEFPSFCGAMNLFGVQGMPSQKQGDEVEEYTTLMFSPGIFLG